MGVGARKEDIETYVEAYDSLVDEEIVDFLLRISLRKQAKTFDLTWETNILAR